MGDKRGDTCRCRGDKIEGDEPQEHYEVLVISVPETIVDIHTVMIEFLYAFPADHAVESP